MLSRIKNRIKQALLKYLIIDSLRHDCDGVEGIYLAVHRVCRERYDPNELDDLNLDGFLRQRFENTQFDSRFDRKDEDFD